MPLTITATLPLSPMEVRCLADLANIHNNFIECTVNGEQRLLLRDLATMNPTTLASPGFNTPPVAKAA